MYTVEQPYVESQNVLALLTKIRKTVVEIVDCVTRAVAAARVAQQNPTDSERILEILSEKK